MISKVTYLVILYFLIFGGWNLKIFAFIRGDIVALVIQLLYMFMGYCLWNGNKHELRINKKELLPFILVFVGVFLSMVSAKLYYGQSFVQSFITYRGFSLWLLLFVLMKIHPSERQIMKSLLICTGMMWVAYLMRLFTPDLLDLKSLYKGDWGEYGIFYGHIIGFDLVVIPFFYYWQKILVKFTIGDFCRTIFTFLFLIVSLSRTLLFAVFIAVLIQLLINKRKNRGIVFIVTGLLITVFMLITIDLWIGLVNETQLQYFDDDYNRNKAFNYFMYNNKSTVWTLLIGHGHISSNVSSFLGDLMNQGIYTSDVGFVGFWYEYGIIPIIGLAIALIRICKVKTYYMKQIGWTMIVCSTSLAYFGLFVHAIWLIISYYLYMEQTENKKDLLRRNLWALLKK